MGRRPSARRGGSQAALAAVSALLILSLLLLAVGCSSGDDGDDATSDDGSSAEQATEGVLRLGVVGPLELDPAEVLAGQDDLIGIDLLYDTLPDLAQPTVDDELRVWTYPLDGATFADGSPLTAADVKFSLERIAEPGEASLRGARLDVIEGYDAFVAGESDELSGVRVVDDETVEITTAEPYGELDRLLVDPAFGIVPQAAADDEGFFEEPVGSGAFLVTDRSDGSLTLERGEGREANLDGVEVHTFETAAESYEAFVDGQLDWSLVPTDRFDGAAEQYGDDHYVPQNIEFWFGINLRNPKFENQLFREAIIHSIDRPKLVAEHFPGALLMDGVVSRGVPGAQDNACGDRCVYIPDLSRELLADAFPDGNVPTVMVDYNEDDFEQAAAEQIEANLEAVGIPAELRPHPLEDYREFVVSGEQELFYFGWIGVGETPDTFLAPLFLSGSPDNVTGYNLGFADGGIAAARAFPDEAERLDGYQQVERAIVGQVPLVPLAQLQTHAVTSDRVVDLVTESDGTFDATKVSVR